MGRSSHRVQTPAVLTSVAARATMAENLSRYSSKEPQMQVTFLGKDPGSNEGDSPTLYATDRADRRTYIAQGWVVTDPEALAQIGPVPEGEALVEIPEDVMKFYARGKQEDR
jgi:hypothetical protein